MKTKVIFVFLIFAAAAFGQFNKVASTTIDSAATTSAYVDLEDWKLAAVGFPATMTGTYATIYTSATSGGTFKALQYDDEDVKVAISASKFCALSPAKTNNLLRYIKVVSDSTEADSRALQIIKTRF